MNNCAVLIENDCIILFVRKRSPAAVEDVQLLMMIAIPSPDATTNYENRGGQG